MVSMLMWAKEVLENYEYQIRLKATENMSIENLSREKEFGAQNDYVLWFRPERIQTVHWAGNSQQPAEVSDDGQRRMPRTSFALWKETVSLKSEPWQEREKAAASDLRTAILELILRSAEEWEDATKPWSAARRTRCVRLCGLTRPERTPRQHSRLRGDASRGAPRPNWMKRAAAGSTR